jgi:hypothetical protein
LFTFCQVNFAYFQFFGYLTMRKTHFSRAVAFSIILSFCFFASAVDTAQVDEVRNKATLADSDTEVIENFLSEALNEFLAKIDFSDIASLRTTIISRSSAESKSSQFQYSPRFLTVAQKQISQALNKVSQMPDSQRKQLLTMNLLILINDLGNPGTSKPALDYLQNPDVMIRYWAVSCLTNGSILSQLNTTESAENSRLAGEFAEKLLTAAKAEQSGDILILLGQFASGLKQPTANEILKEIAQKRINLYLNWQVKDEMVENWILKALSDRPQADPESKSVMAKNFAILYSLVIQRYIRGIEALPAANIRNLVSVITQGEKNLPQFLPDWLVGNLKKAIEKGGGAILQAEHDSLFGSATAPGKLPTAAGFEYDKNPDGSAKTAPPTLQKPPQTEKQPEKKTETQTEKQPAIQPESNEP